MEQVDMRSAKHHEQTQPGKKDFETGLHHICGNFIWSQPTTTAALRLTSNVTLGSEQPRKQKNQQQKRNNFPHILSRRFARPDFAM